MSRLYFHSPSGDAQLKGSERRWLAGLVNDLAVGMLDLHNANRVDRLISLAAPGHFIAQHADRYPNGMALETAYRLAFLHDDPYSPALIQHRGHRIDTFSLALNTAMQLGNEQIRLAARLHAQCEVHAWVDGPNRAWLANVIENGLEAGIYRRRLAYRDGSEAEPKWSDQGWDDVIGLLRSRDDEPVVTSSSVTDQFPNPGPHATEYGDSWYQLDDTNSWRIGMGWLRQAPGQLELRPNNKAYRFEHKLSILDLFSPDWEERIDRAFAPEQHETPERPE